MGIYQYQYELTYYGGGGGTKKKYRVMPLQNMKSIPPAVLYELCRVLFKK